LQSGLNISKDKAGQLLSRFDVDHDGQIDVHEFELMLLKNDELKKHLHH